ncbi:aminopeptidase [Solimonas terrae]|uniref:Aminopeptidase n=1 Tax=Solimonas terrae TaxID=1396819 RepID=A0A6M2BQ46_9GAMM|nr:aminopeptidase [Solimonas terrae]NGY04578.1 aminopeptidase [Solimonas terrae]
MLHSQRVIPTLFLALLLGGCGTLDYYAQAVSGEIAVLRARQPIGELLADPTTPPELKARLALIRDARDWAVTALDLPDNGSYRSYADIQRPYVVWNVFATGEFSTEPVQHCFPVAGCVGYQGWYSEAAARASAAALAKQGDDVYVGGVPAYSTLGWFDDPVLSTMLRWDDASLIATLFHELAHQKLYVKHDTRFNESFAEFVGEQGLREYQAQHPLPQAVDLDARRARSEQFTTLLLSVRARLAALYRQPLTADAMRARKLAVFDELRTEYAQLRAQDWGGKGWYDGFFEAAPLNNARLLPFGLYDDDLPAFATLFADAGGDWRRFFDAAARLAALPAARRAEQVQKLKLAAPKT